MPSYAEIPTVIENGQERFVTDEREREVTDNVVRRMMHPRDCIERLNRVASSRHDLLVDRGIAGLNLTVDPNSGSMFSIAPDIDAGLGNYVRQRGPIPLTEKAVNQIAGLMGVKGGYSRYQKMGLNGSRHFLADFASFFRHRRDDDFNLIFRTKDIGTGRIVEGVMRDDIDRTDSNIFVASAMKGLIERHGDIIRGVEVFESESQGGMEFRILFGNPVMRESERQPTKRLYPMLNISTSDIRAFMPRASLGVWRMWCANGCTTQQFESVAFKMNSSSNFNQARQSLEGMASIAFPYAALIAFSLQNLQQRRIVDNSAIHTLGRLRDNGAISEEFYSRCHDFGQDAYAPNELETEWDLFNLMTDAAKGLGSMAARRNAEEKALTFAMHSGGFAAVAENGYNKNVFEREMAQRISEHVLPLAVHERVDLSSFVSDN